MASDFLKKKAEEQAARTVSQIKGTTPMQSAGQPSGGASDFLKRKAEEQAARTVSQIRTSPVSARTNSTAARENPAPLKAHLPSIWDEMQENKTEARTLAASVGPKNFLLPQETVTLAQAGEMRKDTATLKRKYEEEEKQLKPKVAALKAEKDEAKDNIARARGEANRQMRANLVPDAAAAQEQRTLAEQVAAARQGLEDKRTAYEDYQIDNLGKLNLGSRLGLGARSIGETVGAAPGVIASTAKQSLSDFAQNWNNEQLAGIERGMPLAARNMLNPQNATELIPTGMKADNPVDPESAGMQGMRRAGELGEKALSGLSGGGRFLGETLMSVGQNAALLPLAAVNPALPLAAMAGIAGAQKMYELGEQGTGANKALGRGLIAGGIEAATGKLPLDSALDIIQSGGKGLLKNILKQMGLEATEEGLSYIMNTAADAAHGDMPDMTFGEWLKGGLLASAGGALSGGIFGAGGTAINTGGNVARNVQSSLTDPRALVPNLEAAASYTLPDARTEAAQDGVLGHTGEITPLETETAQGALIPNLEAAASYTLPDARTQAVEAIGLKPYTQHELDNWAGSKRIVPYESPDQARDFVLQALLERDMGKKLYYGAVPGNVAQRVLAETGVDVENYNVSLGGNEVRKILNDHGDFATEDSRGQRAITVEDLLHIPQIVSNPDTIRRGEEDYRGSPVVEFIKTINGRETIITYASKKHRDLAVQTMYSGRNKGSLATLTDAFAPEKTSETRSGTAPTASISNDAGNVNTGVAVHPPLRGDIEKAANWKLPKISDDDIIGQNMQMEANVDGRGQEATAGSQAGVEHSEASEGVLQGQGAAEPGQAAYVRRREESAIQFTERTIREGRVRESAGTHEYGYRPVEVADYTPQASRTVDELRALGIDSFAFDGVFEENNGQTTRSTNADALAVRPLGKVGVNNSQSLDPKNVAAHEMYHLRDNTPQGMAFYDAVYSNFDFSKADAKEYYDAINKYYFDDKLDIMQDGEKFFKELSAFVSGDIYGGQRADQNPGMFKDWDAVVAAWEDMRNASTRERSPGAEGSGEGIAEIRPRRVQIIPRAETQGQAETAKTDPVAALVRQGEKAKQARRDLDKVLRANPMTEHEKQQVNALLKGDIEVWDLTKGSNLGAIYEVYEARKAYNEARAPIAQYNAQRREANSEKAWELIGSPNQWKDKAAGLLYSRETMERNVRDIAPNAKIAEAVNNEYFRAVHHNEANRVKMKNEYRQRVKALDLNRKVAAGNEVSEAYAVQYIGEIDDNIRRLEQERNPEAAIYGMTLDEAKNAKKGFIHNNPNMDWGKVNRAVESFRQMYDRLFAEMNRTRVLNGYEPVDYRKGYFPHFSQQETDTVLAKFAHAMGIDMEVTALPTTINGLTHTFKPGIRWFGNVLERTGYATAYDAVEGFDRYIEGVSDVVHHTEDIQKLRAFANEIRYMASDEGIRERIREAMNDPDMTEDERGDVIRKITDGAQTALSNFVVELDEYTNLLANKKAFGDRNMERNLSRKAYNVAKGLANRVAANMVAINPGSWLTNFIPLTQGGAEISNKNLLGGMLDSLKSYIRDDDFAARSDFLTNRRGSDPLVRTGTQEISATMSKPMEWIDTFTADSLVRGRYAQNIQQGMSEAAALDEADAWAAGVMADRSKGAMPTLFEEKNIGSKLFTQFQLEVNNQLSHMIKDMPRSARGKGKAALTMALLKLVVGAYIFNDVYEALVGRRPAFDPLGMLNDLSGDLTGYELPSIPEAAGAMLQGRLPSFETEKQGLTKAGANFATNVAGEIPFVGGLLGGGRLPISSALPDVGNLWGAASGLASGEGDVRYNWNRLGKELLAPAAHTLLPFGGGQVKKAVEGISSVAKQGSFTVDNQGRDILRFGVPSDTPLEAAGNYAKAALFGRMALPGAQDWVDSGFKNYSAKETAVYQEILELGVAARDTLGLIADLKVAEGDEDETKAAVKRQIVNEAAIPGEAKYVVYHNMLASEKDKGIMDELTGMGEDPGAVYEVINDFKNVKATDDEGSSQQKYDILNRSGLSFEGQTAVYIDSIASEKQLERMEALQDGVGIESRDYYEYQSGTVNLGADKDEKGKSIDGTAARHKLGFIEEMSLTPEQTIALFMSEAASDSFESKFKEKAEEAKALGIEQTDLLRYMVDIGAMTSDKDEAGETVANSKRANVWEYIDGLDLTPEQKDMLHLLNYSEKYLSEAPWRVVTKRTYAGVELPDITVYAPLIPNLPRV